MSPSTPTTSAASSPGPSGPEAGVWVIAETRDLPVRYIKSVVTDDRGRFVVPDLPRASYSVWARGYGLVDSDKSTARPGQRLAITATVAPNEAAAAHYYPAIYWYSMLKIPAADQFGGKSSIPARLTQNAVDQRDEEHRLHRLPSARSGIDAHDSDRRSGRLPAARRRGGGACSRDRPGSRCSVSSRTWATSPFANFGDWTDRVAKGELPFAKPPRPQGVERNIVVTLRDWMNEKQYLHDLIASDRRYPTVNANGPLFGSPEYSSDMLPILDPVKNTARTFKAPVRDPEMPLNLGPGHAAGLDPLQPSPYWGSERIWETRVNNHNSMFGQDGRVWLAASVRGTDNPGLLQGRLGSSVGESVPDGSRDSPRRGVRSEDEEVHVRRDVLLDASSAVRLRRQRHAVDERRRSGRRLAEHEDVRCRRGDAAKSQGWTALILDTNGNGKRDAYVEPDQPLDPTKDKRINAAVLRRDAEPGRRLDLGSDARQSRRRRAARARIESAGDGAGRDLQRAAARLRRARRRHRQQGRGVGVAGERPHRQLRSPQVQGAAQRPEGDGRSLPRGLVVLQVSGSGLRRASATTAPSRAITRGSISTTRSASATTCRCPPAT